MTKNLNNKGNNEEQTQEMTVKGNNKRSTGMESSIDVEKQSSKQNCQMIENTQRAELTAKELILGGNKCRGHVYLCDKHTRHMTTDSRPGTFTVERCWNTSIQGNPMWVLQQKLKTLSKELSKGSRENIGNVYDKVRQMEENTILNEEAYDMDDSEENRQKLHKSEAEYIRWLKMQESILRQKARVKWAEEGDTNNKYFHSIIRERMRKTRIHRIKNENGDWIEGNKEIAQPAIDHFNGIFTQPNSTSDMDILKWCDRLITDEDNEHIMQKPTEEEIKEVIFSMDPNNAAGPDGFNGLFFQPTWRIVKNDVIEFVSAFFRGANLTKYYTHTCLVLIPKVKSPDNFSQMRPISLCSFTNKIISEILTTRISPLLPRIISENQPGFVKGRLITENILTQEIIDGINKKKSEKNIVMKLDMSKAYDKLSWTFLTSVLRKVGFSELVIELIYRLISNNWYFFFD
ncbi:PREDICTED: uncharacterized protein LOC109208320 [Nicotiana attenuata]|uniref:uncharacterized protein LOC109208320 n=1 Tax=Nicotiana attenuata TaxID=49451 RepID=UPI0009050E04|nr:PREDICTED: uncharacterized protein LOC109208320 [Nicotiana attenuata]